MRIGKDVRERLDIITAEFFVHRHHLRQVGLQALHDFGAGANTAAGHRQGVPAPGLLAQTLVSRFVDHIPCYWQETINARSGVHTLRSNLAAWSGAGGAELQPLFDVYREFVLDSQVLHIAETPVNMLDLGAGKTKRA